MEQNISILHLEDQLVDSILIKSLISKWFKSFTYILVDDEAGFVRALREKTVDVILSDYELPGYSGTEALLLAKTKYPHIPFIFVTGKMGEDSAIDSLLNGATDYVMKSKLERLVPAIKRVLHEAELLHARVTSDKALRDSEERYRGLLMNLDAGVVVHAPDTSIIMVNPKASELLGLSEQQLQGRVSIDPEWHFLREDHSRLPVENYPVQQIIEGKKSIKDFRLGVNRPLTGDVVWLTLNGSPVFDKNGEISEIVISFLDITERKQAEDALRQEQYLMEIMMDNIPDHLYFKDLQSRFIRISKSNLQSFRLNDTAEAVGKTDFDFFSQEHARIAYHDEQDIIRTGLPMVKEEKETWEDRPDTWAFSTKMPLRDHDGNIIGTFGISRDISDRKRFEQELLQAKEKAEASDRLKTAFLRTISHEIRTPLNGILGFGLLMSDPSSTSEDKEEYLLMVNESSDRLINTVANIMDTALIVSGNQEVKKQSVAIGIILTEAFNKFNHRCVQKKLTLAMEKHPAVDGLFINADPELISKVLNHLIDNALKFTKSGGITIGCQFQDNAVEFSVADTGIGIRRNDQQTIFDHFTQGNDSNTREQEGSGLGLSIAKGFVDLLGGRIWVESTPGAGSVFRFTIPIEPGDQVKSEIQQKLARQSGKPLILVVDDEELNSMLVSRLLQKEGIEVMMVSDGQQAVDACKGNNLISLVLMDLKMPVMDGFEATKIIKSFHPDLPIIALTAYAMGGDENKAREAGCNDYITKPLRKELLMYKLIQYGVI